MKRLLIVVIFFIYFNYGLLETLNSDMTKHNEVVIGRLYEKMIALQRNLVAK